MSKAGIFIGPLVRCSGEMGVAAYNLAVDLIKCAKAINVWHQPLGCAHNALIATFTNVGYGLTEVEMLDFFQQSLRNGSRIEVSVRIDDNDLSARVKSPVCVRLKFYNQKKGGCVYEMAFYFQEGGKIYRHKSQKTQYGITSEIVASVAANAEL